jgi:hypothetical protein
MKALKTKSAHNNAIEPTGNSLFGFLRRLVAPVGSWQTLYQDNMIKQICCTAMLCLLLIGACTPTQEKRRDEGNSFRTVPDELREVNWSRTPNIVMQTPLKDEPLIWLGVVKDVSVKQKDNKIEIEWLCQYLNFANPGPAAISVRPMKAQPGEGYFALSLILEKMTLEKAKELQKEHLATPQYMLAGGKFDGFVQRKGMRVPFLYTYRFSLGPNLAIIEK